MIDEEKNMLGVLPVEKALYLAKEKGLDLIEVSPNANPPVCKLGDYGKIRYEEQKKQNIARKRQKVLGIKEVKMSQNIGVGDYETKLRHAKKFLEKGHKVKFTFYLKGREISRPELIQELMAKIIEETKEISKIDAKPKLEGRRLSFVLSSNK